MIRKSGSPLPVGSVASQSTSASAAARRVWLQLPWPSPRSGSPTSLQSEPFDLRWLTATVKRAPVAFTSNVCASDGPALRVDEARVDGGRQELEAPTGVTTAGR